MYRYSVFKRNTYIFIYTIYTAVYHIYMYIYRYTPSLAFQRITGRICFTVTASGGWWGVANEWMDQKKEVYFCNFWVLYHAPKKTYLPSKLNHLFKKKKNQVWALFTRLHQGFNKAGVPAEGPHVSELLLKNAFHFSSSHLLQVAH